MAALAVYRWMASHRKIRFVFDGIAYSIGSAPWRRRVVAVIASLHQVQLGVTYADRIAALRAGRIVEDAPAARFDTRAIGQI